MTQAYIRWQPHLTIKPHLGSQPRQAPLFILASLHLAVITGVPHSWLNGSTGVPAVPVTISMSVIVIVLVIPDGIFVLKHCLFLNSFYYNYTIFASTVTLIIRDLIL